MIWALCGLVAGFACYELGARAGYKLGLNIAEARLQQFIASLEATDRLDIKLKLRNYLATKAVERPHA